MTNFRNAMMAAAQTAAGGGAVTSVGNSALYNTANSGNLTYTEQAGTSTNKQYISFWMYFTGVSTAANFIISCDDGSNNNRFQIYFGSTLTVLEVKGGSVQCYLISTRQLRDIGWYHIELLLDTTQSVASNRNILKVNNVRLTEFSTETNFTLNDTFGTLGSAGKTFHWGRSGAGTGYLGAYLAESVRIDGDPAGISTGEYDETGLYWTPKSSTAIKALTFGDNGFYLDNTTNAQTDASGEAHNFTNNNTVTTTTHTPTNLNCLLSPLDKNDATVLSNGNRTQSDGSASWRVVKSTFTLPTTGKWYWEMTWSAGSSDGHVFGVCLNSLNPRTISASGNAGGYAWSTYGGKYIGATGSTYASAPTNSDKIGFLFDSDAGTLIFYKNNSSQGTLATGLTFASVGLLNVYSNLYDSWVPTFHFNEAEWEYSAPADHKALTTTVLAETTTRTASDTNKYFQTTLYEGNGGGQRVGAFQPFGNAFTVAYSGLFNLVSTGQSTSNAWLTRSQDAGASQKKFTFSFWFKMSDISLGTNHYIWGDDASYYSGILFNSSEKLTFMSFLSTTQMEVSTDRVFHDPSQWYHAVVAVDTAQSAALERIRIYINGVEEAVTVTNQVPQDSTLMSVGDANDISVGAFIASSAPRLPYDGYLAEFVYINNVQLTPSSFGQTDTSTNRWVPKAVSGLTYDATGYYLNFAGATSDLGDDASGNSNDFANNNNNALRVTDSPTTNFAVLNPTFCYAPPTAGNLVMDGYASYSSNVATLGLTSGKWYWEMTCGSTVGAPMMGVVPFDQKNKAQYPGQAANGIGWDGGNAYRNNSALISSYGSAMANGQVNAVMLDLDSTPQTITFRQANSQLATINLIVNTTWFPYFRNGGAADASNATLNFGASSFTYTPPTGFIALSQDNMAGTDQFISAFSWIKNRDATDNHMLFDRVRGATNYLQSSANIVNTVNVNTVQRFLEAGVQVGNDVQVNTASESYVLWNFMTEATGSGTSNASGDITTTCLVDTTLGMSVGTYTGSGVSGNTVGTGLDDCKIFIVKRMSNATNWPVTFPDILTDDYQVYLDSTGAQGAGGFFDTSANTGGQIGLTAHYSSNASSQPYFFLAFNSSQFISIGSYEGNGNANGTFAPTLNSLGIPIQPIFFFSKNIDATNNWDARDIIRSPYNPSTNNLQPSTSGAEVNGTDYVDIVTGGLKLRTSSANLNGSAKTIAYVAIGTPIIDVDGRIIAGR